MGKYALIKVKDGLVNGLKTYYYTWFGNKPPDELLSLKPVYEDVSPWINYVWWNNPAPNVPSEFFAIAWIGFIEIDRPGFYRFYITVDDGGRLWIDDELIIDSWRDQPPTTYVSKPIYLSRGYHRLRYYFYNRYAFSEAVLGWIPAEGEAGVVPKEKLYHCIGDEVFFTNIPDDHVVKILPVNREEISCRSIGSICRVKLSSKDMPLEAIVRITDPQNKVLFETTSKILIWGGDEFKLVEMRE